MVRAVIAFVVLAILAVAGTAVFGAALDSGGVSERVANESFTPDAGNVTQLDESGRSDAIYADTVTVRDANDSVVEAGSDYEWIASNGTVRALAGGELANDSTASITYEYNRISQDRRDLTGLLAQTPRIVGLLLPLGAVLFFFRMVGA